MIILKLCPSREQFQSKQVLRGGHRCFKKLNHKVVSSNPDSGTSLDTLKFWADKQIVGFVYIRGQCEQLIIKKPLNCPNYM